MTGKFQFNHQQTNSLAVESIKLPNNDFQNRINSLMIFEAPEAGSAQPQASQFAQKGRLGDNFQFYNNDNFDANDKRQQTGFFQDSNPFNKRETIGMKGQSSPKGSTRSPTKGGNAFPGLGVSGDDFADVMDDLLLNSVRTKRSRRGSIAASFRSKRTQEFKEDSVNSRGTGSSVG
jgi:hypothetical protein